MTIGLLPDLTSYTDSIFLALEFLTNFILLDVCKARDLPQIRSFGLQLSASFFLARGESNRLQLLQSLKLHPDWIGPILIVIFGYSVLPDPKVNYRSLSISRQCGTEKSQIDSKT